MRGSSSQILDETKRCMHDAICNIKSMIKNNKILCGGGSSEIFCSRILKRKFVENKFVVDAYCNSLLSIPK